MTPIRFLFVFLVGFGLIVVFSSAMRRRFSGAKLVIDNEKVTFGVSRNSKQNSVASVAIGIDLPDTMRFSVRQEAFFDRFAKRIGLAHELQTGDVEFDSAVYVLSDDTILLNRLVVDHSLRNALLQLVLSSRSVHCSYGKLWVVMGNRGFDYSQSDVEIATQASQFVLESLNKARERIKNSAAEMWTTQRDVPARMQTFALSLTTLLGVVGMITWSIGLGLGLPRQLAYNNIEHYEMLAAAGSAVALIVLLLMALRICSRTHILLVQVLLIGVPSSWLIAHAYFDWANRAYDDSRPTSAEVTVADKFTHKASKGSRSYYFAIHDWPDRRADGRYSVGENKYNSVNIGECIRVTWHNGHFNDPWISDFVPEGIRCRE